MTLLDAERCAVDDLPARGGSLWRTGEADLGGDGVSRLAPRWGFE
jgi:hypothetical protein